MKVGEKEVEICRNRVPSQDGGCLVLGLAPGAQGPTLSSTWGRLVGC